MSRWIFEDYLFWFITIGTVLFLIGLIFIAVPMSIQNEREFVAACTAKGGVPSKYETMVGKTSQSERLCIKKDNIVELEP
jgi:hypothetical protein